MFLYFFLAVPWVGLSSVIVAFSGYTQLRFVYVRPYTKHNALARGYKTNFMLNSAEHQMSTGHKNKMLKHKDCFGLKTLRCSIYSDNEC